jgi:peptidoglycan/LPS O-acetylase OafA/YrhL
MSRSDEPDEQGPTTPVVPEPSDRPHSPTLDGVRGLAILLVLLFHGAYPYHLIAPDHPFALFDFGWMGVDVFFVLSGFLITGILLEAKRRPRYFVHFYGRRTLRIFPLYYLVLGVVFIVMPLLVSDLELGAPESNQVYLWTYTSNLYTAYMGQWMFHSGTVDLNHTWSLAIEEQFYLLWPLLVRWTSRRSLIWICGAIFLATPLVRLLAVDAGASVVAL